MGCTCGETTGGSYKDDCDYLTAAYILAGLSMMLNIRLAYSSAPYALIRFRLPENLFSVFVRRMASALELWCLPSMLLGNIVDVAMKLSAESKENFKLDHSKQQNQNEHDKKLGKLIKMKHWKFLFIIIPSMVTMWSDFITYVVLLYVYVTGGHTGNVTAYYGVIAVSGFIFGINMTLVYAADWRYIPVYIAGENAFPMLTSFIHYITTLIFGNRRKWNSDFLIVCIDISVAIIISLVTATLWTSAYALMKHKSPNKIFRFGVLPGPYGFADPYGTTRNTSLTFNVTLNDSTGSGADKFASSGTITITVGGTNFATLSDSSTNNVQITLSNSGSSIKKCVEGKATDFKTSEELQQNTKLDIDAKGTINTPITADVTIKGTVEVSTENVALGTSLKLGPVTNDPSSTGLTGSITPQDSGGKAVTIQSTSTITLRDEALNALKSLTKNAVTLTKGSFKSSASITVTSGEGNKTDLSALYLSGGKSLQITISEGGTIKKFDKNNQLENLQTNSTQLPVGTKLFLDATGQITQPAEARGKAVNIEGIMVVTNKDKQTLGQSLTFGGGSNGKGVGGSLTLDATGKITGTNLTITSTAYTIIKKASDTNETSFTIGAADPRNIDDPHKTAIKAGAGGDANLATESSFQNYWQLLPTNNYAGTELPYLTSIFPALMIMVGMGFVFCIYPGIAPGMIVPFYLIDKIETVLLVLTTFPPVIVAILRKHKKELSPTNFEFPAFKAWYEYPAGKFYLFLNILMVIKMTLLAIFIYCLHYRDSNISRSIVNQPKMSTFLSIVFYMCHECLLALGFSGFIGNNGGDFILIPQYVGALLMIFLAFYSEGYIIEYKSHDPAHWPTEGMTKWNAFCYWYSFCII